MTQPDDLSMSPYMSPPEHFSGDLRRPEKTSSSMTTGCSASQLEMVRKGSTVRVRQRALTNRLVIATFGYGGASQAPREEAPWKPFGNLLENGVAVECLVAASGPGLRGGRQRVQEVVDPESVTGPEPRIVHLRSGHGFGCPCVDRR